MEAEFNSLEAKVAQFVSLCERLRAENLELKRSWPRRVPMRASCTTKIDGAKARLEGLLSRLPG